MTVSGASVTASFVNSTTNSTVKVPPEFNPERKPGDEVQPQFWWIIGLIILDLAAHWFLEHYVSPEVAAVYDAVTILIDPAKIAEKLGIKGAELGIKVISRNKVLIGLFKDNKVVKEITYASKETAKWVENKLGKDYISKILEKYVVKDGGLKKGEDFDDVVNSLRRIQSMGITSAAARRLIIDRGWDVKKLEEVLGDVKSVDNGGSKLISKINQELARGQLKSGALYEAEVVSHLKRSGWTIKEVEKRVITSIDKNTEIDIIAEKGSQTVLIECKRNAHKITKKQLAKYAEYAINKGIRKIGVYYAGGIENIRDYYYYTQYLPREIKSRFGVDVEVRYLASEFE